MLIKSTLKPTVERIAQRDAALMGRVCNNLEDKDEIAAFLAAPENAKEGLPCLLLHGTPFGIFLSGNCALREHEEIFAHGANPNTHPDPTRLAAEGAAFFEGEKNPVALHL